MTSHVKMLIKTLALTLPLIVVAACNAQTDHVVMANGSEVSGVIIGYDEGTFTIRPDASSEIQTIKSSDIRSIEFDASKQQILGKTKIKKETAVLLAGKMGKFFNPDYQAFGRKIFTPKEAAHNEILSIRVSDVRIAKPSVKDMFDRVKQTSDDYLVIKLRIKNNDKRKIMRYKPANIFGISHSLLIDDAQNEIRPLKISRPVESVVGELTGDEDYNPGEVAEHTLVYRVPPEPTVHVLLSYDLAAFGCEGIVRFNIIPKLDYKK